MNSRTEVHLASRWMEMLFHGGVPEHIRRERPDPVETRNLEVEVVAEVWIVDGHVELRSPGQDPPIPNG